MHAITMQKSSKALSTYLMERNLLTTFFKVLDAGNIILLLPYVLLLRLIAMLKDVFTLRFNLAFARIKAIFYVLLNFDLIVKKRKETQKFRKADDKYVLKIFSERYLFKERFIV